MSPGINVNETWYQIGQRRYTVANSLFRSILTQGKLVIERHTEEPIYREIGETARADADRDRIMAIFEAAGVRSTNQRRLIAERLAMLGARGDGFVTQDLWKELRAEDSGMGRATVFRAVELLQREGVLDRVAFANGTHRYRLCGKAHHHHVTCLACRRVEEVDVCLPPELLSAIAVTTDFTIEGHALDLFGRCSDCRMRGVADAPGNEPITENV